METDKISTAIALFFVAGLALIVASVIRRKEKATAGAVDRERFDPSLVNNIRYQIVPYLISADLLPRTIEYTIYRYYSYTRSFLAGIVGIGIAPPIVDYLNKVAQGGARSDTTSLQVPPGIGYLALFAAIVLVAFSVYSSQSNLDKRAVLADSCATQFRAYYAKLLDVLRAEDAEAKLDALSNEIATTVQRHITEKDWTFNDVIAPGIEDRVELMTDDILARINLRATDGPQGLEPKPPVTIQQVEK